MTEKEKLERENERLKENIEQLESHNKQLGKCLMHMVRKPFINRLKIRKMYKANGFDMAQTVELYFGLRW